MLLLMVFELPVNIIHTNGKLTLNSLRQLMFSFLQNGNIKIIIEKFILKQKLVVQSLIFVHHIKYPHTSCEVCKRLYTLKWLFYHVHKGYTSWKKRTLACSIDLILILYCFFFILSWRIYLLFVSQKFMKRRSGTGGISIAFKRFGFSNQHMYA